MKISAGTKIFALAIFGILTVMLSGAYEFAILFAVTIISMLALRVNINSLLRLFLPAIPVIAVISIAQAVLVEGGDVLASFWIVDITSTGAELAAASAARMILLYLAGSVVTITTSETEFADTVERSLRPLSRVTKTEIGRDIATMMMLAITFLPVIYSEYQSIRMAQESRGVSFKGPVNALKGILSITVPLLYALSNRADRVAIAMESRCYGIKDPRQYEKAAGAPFDAPAPVYRR
ncbi:energy-coupling factor transporter transmembrane protein EcfT [Methanocella sp. CWC-04]|uniref:Energy-coupling factor transporter transmembrane protein EcfT n=1 Tax=Methanooceanicella nereidis TaxID=2052831 RepID=A0AAP2RAZ8_9EURY|nr:energy-coupling factor transporter transmembrane component T [Methanocella sp. CWC-04]MCD1294226.1 energy-coupling factor transporter transmembrane protein EcfT [Methanocella sp. CWC-04]